MSLSDAHYFEEMSVKKYEEIRKLLDSREKKDKLEGMKRLLAMISIGRDASDFFPVRSHLPLHPPALILKSSLRHQNLSQNIFFLFTPFRRLLAGCCEKRGERLAGGEEARLHIPHSLR